MFSHEKVLEIINAGLRAIGAKQLDGIPVAAPGHSRECVLGCSYDALLTSDDSERFGVIELSDGATAEAVMEAWRAEGVDCEIGDINVERLEGYPAPRNRVTFRGDLWEWMDAFDGGRWEQLIVPGYDRDRFDWGTTNPGETTIAPEELPPVEERERV